MTLRVCAALACTTDEGIGLNGAAAARVRVAHMLDRELEKLFAITITLVILAALD
jgi:hypothetical protein